MKKIWIAACVYAALGLFAGLLYRTLMHSMDVIPKTQLATLHTHLLSLGMIVMLVVLALDAVFHISNTRAFKGFFHGYNTGLALTAGVMLWQGIVQLGGHKAGAAAAGIAGLGHIAITVGIVFLLVSLAGPVRELAASRES
ncbi:hypothetical protein J2S49_001612 [Arcanobacterium wilhelmae]|uniref:DUF2871 domain-containing protein n=1 Tax=Arcanobacterium wilhelmae TaxID=1803177 RepID=A0ABT9NCU6_9ACTO|nr:DUF2871 family protein [Arcanobacterium wilhelmae]MDP9801536.1 hypothetical protein [Arcanobacterium wilhelmae]